MWRVGCGAMARGRLADASLVGVQGLVEAGPIAGPRTSFQGTGHAVAPEHHVAHARQLASRDDRSVRQQHLRAGGDIATRLDDAVVTEGDTNTGVGAEQASLAERDDD